jgi:predicted LPLAT superfamily acyltransferase
VGVVTAPFAALIVAVVLALAVYGAGCLVWGFHLGSQGACRACRSAPCSSCGALVAALARSETHRGQLLAEDVPADVAGIVDLGLAETAAFASITEEPS